MRAAKAGEAIHEVNRAQSSPGKLLLKNQIFSFQNPSRKLCWGRPRKEILSAHSKAAGMRNVRRVHLFIWLGADSGLFVPAGGQRAGLGVRSPLNSNVAAPISFRAARLCLFGG